MSQMPTAPQATDFHPLAKSEWNDELVGRPAHLLIAQFLEHALQRRASDLFLTSTENGVDVSMRRLGLIEPMTGISREEGLRCLALLRTMSDIRLDERRRPQDGRSRFLTSSNGHIDLRVNTMPTIHGESVAVRILAHDVHFRDTARLGLVGPQSESLQRILQSPSGLVLVTGPTGSGKTTTLYACLEQLNDGTRKIHTLENPIEYRIPAVQQTQISDYGGPDFYEMLRAVMRQNPDVIMIGEIRDTITAETAIRAANSGQLVFSTLHATSAANAIQSMFALGAQPDFLAASLLAVISQRLIRVLSPLHRVAISIDDANMFREVQEWLDEDDGAFVYAAKPTSDQPYLDRTAVFEFLEVTEKLRELIASRKTAHEIANHAEAEGMFNFRRAALLKLAKGITTVEEVRRTLAVNSCPHELRKR